MLHELIQMWKKIGLLEKALKNFLKMIDSAEQMFACSVDALFDPAQITDARDLIYKKDVKVNKKQRKIRKELVEHLAVNPRADAPACLILMSVIKDVERAGDYCKNLLEVADMAKQPIAQSKYASDLREMAADVAGSFALTRKAFAEEDHSLASQLIVQETKLAKRGDATIEKVADDDELDANQAVCLALAFRFLKRVDAHLGNVASSVVMPLHKIDYFDEKLATKDIPDPQTAQADAADQNDSEEQGEN